VGHCRRFPIVAILRLPSPSSRLCLAQRITVSTPPCSSRRMVRYFLCCALALVLPLP
jgi:hypothetical protein